MKIGTDVSISVCRIEGYPVIEFKKRELFKEGKLDKNHLVRLTISDPSKWTDTGKTRIFRSEEYATGYKSGVNIYVVEADLSFKDLLDIISKPELRKSIADCCDWENCPINFDNPNEYDFLRLASDIHCHSGLNNWFE